MSDNGTGGLVVYVIVARRIAQGPVRLDEGRSILGEDRAGEAVGTGAIDHAQGLGPALRGIDVNREHRPEELLAHEPVLRIVHLEQRWLDEDRRFSVNLLE